jgi:hypothetical protein
MQGQQRERQKQRMGIADKAMYKFGQLVFGSQGARLFTFGYLMALHFMVFVLLARLTHHGNSQLYAHTQSVLDAKHDLMGAMHTEDHPALGLLGGGNASTSAPLAKDPRLP